MGLPGSASHLLDDAVSGWRNMLDSWQGIPVDVSEKEGWIEVRAAVPGYRPQDVNVDMEDERTLRIEAAGPPEAEAEQRRSFRLHEIASGPRQRSLVLPDAVDRERAEASLSDGILTIRLPRKSAQRITVRGAAPGDATAMRQNVGTGVAAPTSDGPPPSVAGDKVGEASWESFPASDPPSHTGIT